MNRAHLYSLAGVLTLLALAMFGGITIQHFVIILLIGVFSGTYSSIFNAAALLVVWENREWNTWFRGKPVMVNSAFRSKAVNDAVGSKDTSQQHTTKASHRKFARRGMVNPHIVAGEDEQRVVVESCGLVYPNACECTALQRACAV